MPKENGIPQEAAHVGTASEKEKIMKSFTINATAANRKALRAHAKEAMRNYSPVMTWLVIEADGNLYEICEPQGQTYYRGDDYVLATTGGFRKAHGDGAARNDWGEKYRTQRDYLKDLLGKEEYARIFEGADFEPSEYKNDLDY